MNTSILDSTPRREAAAASLGLRLISVGEFATRYSIVVVLAWIGAMKFTGYEASAIEGLVASSPILAWLYAVLDAQGVSNLIGSIEIAIALALVLGSFHRGAALLGALGAIATFAITLTFLFSAPGWESTLGGFPALSVVPGQFLLKDVVLLAASVSLLGTALANEGQPKAT